MNILQINTEKTWRGGEKQTLLTAEGLTALGNRVEILCRKGHPLAHKATQRHILCHEVGNSLQAMAFLTAHGSSFDILHAQTAKAQSAAVLTKPFHRTPIVYTRRVDFKPRGLPARFKYRHTDKVVAISQAIAQVLDDFGVANDRVIPSAIDLRAPVPSPPKHIADNILKQKHAGKKIILSIAALVPHKDPYTMIKAAKQLHIDEPKAMFFHCGSGNLEPDITRLVLKAGLQKCYFLLGFVDNAEGLLPLADVFVMSSQEEGLGSTVLEAFRHKIPVATTNAGGLKEIVPGHGLVSPIHEPKELARNIQYLLSDTELAQSLVAKAYDYVCTHHAHETMASRYLTLYQSMFQNN
ncbi:glycosyltransferase family 4 protein [Desulfoplanes formicivorans]|uniref:Glycosyl transferase n=1 Tax=Desulfoplanes formicivorans TaxID=1592317 RepID=A0A194AB02_9BACT|nr:glycosyltransferase family 4 protein [Desulfoplanes formicivorans]GAU07357.1 glycosyl transferase [Desulfoplanes formicivorans]